MDTKKRFVLLLLIASICLGTGFAFAAPAWRPPEVRIAALETVTIDGGAGFTNSADVTLTISVSGDVAKMSLSPNGTLWPGWEDYAVIKPWHLPGGDGDKTVWARFLSSTDTVSGPVVGSIFLDRVVPTAPVTAPKVSTKTSKTNVFKVSWKGADSAPSSGIVAYDVHVRTDLTGSWTAFKTAFPATSAYFTGVPGETYYFKARAHDLAGNTGPWSSVKKTIVPYDDTSFTKRAGFGGTISNLSSNYYLGTVRYSTKKGDTITYSFTGNYFALIGTKGPKLSQAVVIIDGVKNTIDAQAATKKFRQVLMEKSLTMKAHTVKIKNLGTPGRSRFEVDANAVGK